MDQWQQFVRNQMRLGGHGIASPKPVCIDIQPYASAQAPDRGDIPNVGGFSDAVFSVVAAFLSEDAGRFARAPTTSAGGIPYTSSGTT
jgi:60 kDa SS-A/Ro ribonucleoprotein